MCEDSGFTEGRDNDVAFADDVPVIVADGVERA